MMYSVMALDVLGYPPDHPLRVEALRQFESLMVDDGERFFFQPCFSPVWDTAIAAYALAKPGGSATRPVRSSARPTGCSHEIRRKGDWSVKRPDTEPSGWAFEFRNDYYPDIDDTAMVMLALEPRRGVRSGGAGGLPPAGARLAARHAVAATAAGRPSTSTTTGNS